MSATIIESRPQRVSGEEPRFVDALRAEWTKITTVRSTWWTLVALVVLGAGLTTVLCWVSASWLASGDSYDAPEAYITWGMMIAQAAAVVLGSLVVTYEYGSGMIRTTFAAVPARGRVMAAKSIVVVAVLFIAGTVTALLGYVGGNFFLEREGVGVALEGDVLRAMYGSGLYLAGLGLFSAAVGFLVRHTAAAISIVLALIFVIGMMAEILPGNWGEWVEKLMPSNAGSVISTPVSFDPNLLDPWPGFGVFMAQVAVLMCLAWVVVRRRDA